MKFLDSVLEQLVPVIVEVLLKILFAAVVYFVGTKLIKLCIKLWKKSKAYS